MSTAKFVAELESLGKLILAFFVSEDTSAFMDKTSKLPDRDILAASLKPHCPSSMHYCSKLGPVLFGDNNHYAVMSASYDKQRDEYNDHMISAAEDYFIDLAEHWR